MQLDLDVAGRERSVVLKRGSAAEIAALRALAVVVGVDRPRLIAAGRDGVGDWLLMPCYDGSPVADGAELPEEVWDTLGRVHAHWLRRRPRGLPVVDARWWQALAEQRIAPALRGAAARCADPSGDPIFESGARAVTNWARDRRLLAALALLPKTLVHGDPHRGNLLWASGSVTIIDWGNAKVAPAGLDLAVLKAQGAIPSAAYRRRLVAVRGQDDERILDVERHWADVSVHVAYLGFAADHLGAGRVAEMIETAAAALNLLGTALADLR
ncbi:MAG: aminoglycoside phosphotransferase family protein [Geodermatophilaceae bacterium]|nr:aminoglycoside phosphotransferase family protein [Geodermatophilaceae bacterium]